MKKKKKKKKKKKGNSASRQSFTGWPASVEWAEQIELIVLFLRDHKTAVPAPHGRLPNSGRFYNHTRRHSAHGGLTPDVPFRIEGIQVDGGSEFRAEFEDACRERNLCLFVLPPKRPQLNGHVERAQGSPRRTRPRLVVGPLRLPKFGKSTAAPRPRAARAALD